MSDDFQADYTHAVAALDAMRTRYALLESDRETLRDEVQDLAADLAAARARIAELEARPAEPTPEPWPKIPDFGRFSRSAGTYQQGSGESIEFLPGPDFPAGGSVVFQTWSDVTRAIEAAMTAYEPPYVYSHGRLNRVTPGTADVQALVRYADQRIVYTASMPVTFVAPEPETPAPTVPAEPKPPTSQTYARAERVNPSNVAEVIARQKSDVRIIFEPGEYKLAKPLNVLTARHVLLEAEGAVTLIDDDPAPNDDGLKCLIGIGSDALDIKIRGFRFHSPDFPWMKMANGVNVSGDDCEIVDCVFDGTYQGVLASNKCAGLLIARNRYESCGYGNYINSRDTTIRDNWSGPKCVFAFVRTNQFANLAIENNELIGDVSAGPDNEPSRITIQKGDGAVIRGNELTDTSCSVFPLSSKDGPKQEGDRFTSIRTRNVRVENNTHAGAGGFVIGNRTENVVFVGQPEPKVQVGTEMIDTYEGTKIAVVGAKNVTVNGRKVA